MTTSLVESGIRRLSQGITGPYKGVRTAKGKICGHTVSPQKVLQARSPRVFRKSEATLGETVENDTHEVFNIAAASYAVNGRVATAIADESQEGRKGSPLETGIAVL